jgi:hypothetical protein
MDKNTIKEELKVMSEATVSGEKDTKKAQKISKKENEAYYKDVEKKMDDYGKEISADADDSIETPKVNYNADKEKDYHDEMEIRNGQEMIQYDRDPNEKFKDRAIKSIEGDSTMGNKTYTGAENGNTEPVWGASDAEFGKKLTKTINKSAKKRKDATPTLNQFGDDIEAAKGTAKAVTKKIATEGMKRITFKKPFDGVGNALRLIPEAFKVEAKKFELTDGNEKYLIEWKDNRPTVLKASDQNMISESFNKIKHLMGYKSEDTIGTPDAKQRVSENKRIFENATGVAFGSQGNGFTSEGDLMEDDTVTVDGEEMDKEDYELHKRKYGVEKDIEENNKK